jgi:hypothetical protein
VAATFFTGIAQFLRNLMTAAEQLTAEQHWYRIFSHALRYLLKRRRP